jgi:protein-disulfide isomerase
MSDRVKFLKIMKEVQAVTKIEAVKKIQAVKNILMSMALVAWGVTGVALQAQAPPVVSPATAQADRATTPAAPAPQAGAVPSAPAAEVSPFPPVNPKNFTAATPTPQEVDSFLKALWGYDEGRSWSVAAIQKTPAPGVSKVVVFVADKGQSGKGRSTVFYVTPDGKHAIADAVIDFGAKPFAATRSVLQERADGPAKGAAGKDLMLVEFVDLQDPRSRSAQDAMTNLADDFPQARIVVQPLPIMDTHPSAMRAALTGVCVRKTKGDAAYFTFQQAVFDKQAGLTAAGAADTLNAAVVAAGADPKAVAACVAGPEAARAVQASIKLADEIGVDQTPSLVINGHSLPVGSLPYEALRKIIAFQAGQDGVVVHLQPTLTTLK